MQVLLGKMRFEISEEGGRTPGSSRFGRAFSITIEVMRRTGPGSPIDHSNLRSSLSASSPLKLSKV